MSSMRSETQVVPPTDNVQRTSKGTAPAVNTTEKQEGDAQNQNPPKQSAMRTNLLTQEQILDIRQPTAQFAINTLLQVSAFVVAIAFGIFAIKSVNVADLGNSYATQALQQARAANQLTLLAFCYSILNGSEPSDMGSICSAVVDAADSMVTGVASALFTNLAPLTSPTTTLTQNSYSISSTLAPSSTTSTTSFSSGSDLTTPSVTSSETAAGSGSAVGSVALTTASTASSTLPAASTSATAGNPTPASGFHSISSAQSSIIGIVVGVVVGLLALLILFTLMYRRRARLQRQLSLTVPAESEESQPLLQRNRFNRWFRETFMDAKIIVRAR